MSKTNAPVLLFAYGTLQNRSVQVESFGRTLAGRPDALPFHVRRRGGPAHPAIAALTGETHYDTIEPSADPGDAVPGMLFEITAEELAKADDYEAGANYRRIAVTLRSGAQAWVYLPG